MKQKLMINGFKKISSGKILDTAILPLTDMKIKLVQYQTNDKTFFMFETTFTYLGYTEDIDFAQALSVASKGLTFDEFYKLTGRK